MATNKQIVEAWHVVGPTLIQELRYYHDMVLLAASGTPTGLAADFVQAARLLLEDLDDADQEEEA